MEEEKVPSKPADARIVRAVRKLKSTVSHKNDKSEDNKIKERQKFTKAYIKSIKKKRNSSSIRQKFITIKRYKFQ